MKVFIGSGKVTTIIRREGDMVLPHSMVDVTNIENLYSALSPLPADAVVVNTAAKINLEWCEEHLFQAWQVNALGAENVGKVCQDLDLQLVHVSSGCIFDGGTELTYFDEESAPNPACVYARAKAEGDVRLLGLGYDKVTIVRPRQLFSARPWSTNMITKFAAMESGRFITFRQSVTCVEDLGDMIDHLAYGRHYGVFNCANTGLLSPFEMATAIQASIAPHLKVEPIEYEDYVRTLKVRRVNTLLSIDKLLSTGYQPRLASDALAWCLTNQAA